MDFEGSGKMWHDRTTYGNEKNVSFYCNSKQHLYRKVTIERLESVEDGKAIFVTSPSPGKAWGRDRPSPDLSSLLMIMSIR